MAADLAAGRKFVAMKKENQKTDVSSLSLSWQEKVKDIRRRARENFEYFDESHVTKDSDLFTGAVHESLSAKQIFTGNDDFYKFMETVPVTDNKISFESSRILKSSGNDSNSSAIQKILVAGIAIIFVMVLYLALKSPSAPSSVPSSAPSPEIVVAKAPETPKILPPPTAAPKEAINQPQESAPLSFKATQTLYLSGNYTEALQAYEALHKNLTENPEEQIMQDYLQLQIGLCMEHNADYKQATPVFRNVSQSKSPLIRAIASYHLSLLEMHQNEFLEASTNAYKAIALIEAANLDDILSQSIKRDCHFLAAEALTRKVFSFYDADKDLPEDLWGTNSTINEFFASLDETKLRTFLNSGMQELNQAVLGPKIEKSNFQDQQPRYTITCNGASIEELMEKFAANSGLNLKWTLNSTDIAVRKRQVYLYLSSTTEQQFITAAAGSVGLLAQAIDSNTVNIYYPAGYSSFSENISVLSDESVSLWQKFLFMFHDDRYLANVHFTIGLLKAQQGRVDESIAEYKLVANKFSLSSLAPFALFNIGKLKLDMRDYLGARADLNQLVEQFPDTKVAEKAYLCLADNTANAKLYSEAAKLYCKVYNLSTSNEAQKAASLGAGRCFYEIASYESAQKWLNHHIELAKEQPDQNLYTAYLFLGKTYLALKNPKAACTALQYSLNKQLPNEQYIEAVATLTGEYINQQQFVQAMTVFEQSSISRFSQEQSIEILLLKSKLFRAMGLIDKSIAILGDSDQNVTDKQLKAKIRFEMSKCYIEKGDLELASNQLTETLAIANPGDLSNEITLELAEVCLKLGQEAQTISSCSRLLDSEISEQTKQKALNLVAAAYNQQQNYENAALALLGQWK